MHSGERVTPVTYDTSGMPSASPPQKAGVKQAQTGSQRALGEDQVQYGKTELPSPFDQPLVGHIIQLRRTRENPEKAAIRRATTDVR